MDFDIKEQTSFSLTGRNHLEPVYSRTNISPKLEPILNTNQKCYDVTQTYNESQPLP